MTGGWGGGEYTCQAGDTVGAHPTQVSPACGVTRVQKCVAVWTECVQCHPTLIFVPIYFTYESNAYKANEH